MQYARWILKGKLTMVATHACGLNTEMITPRESTPCPSSPYEKHIVIYLIRCQIYDGHSESLRERDRQSETANQKIVRVRSVVWEREVNRNISGPYPSLPRHAVFSGPGPGSMMLVLIMNKFQIGCRARRRKPSTKRKRSVLGNSERTAIFLRSPRHNPQQTASTS